MHNYRIEHTKIVTDGTTVHRCGVFEGERMVAFTQQDTKEQAEFIAGLFILCLTAKLVVTVDAEGNPQFTTQKLSMRDTLMYAAIAMAAPVYAIRGADEMHGTDTLPLLFDLFESIKNKSPNDSDLKMITNKADAE